jgi:hypothetical protein
MKQVSRFSFLVSCFLFEVFEGFGLWNLMLGIWILGFGAWDLELGI